MALGSPCIMPLALYRNRSSPTNFADEPYKHGCSFDRTTVWVFPKCRSGMDFVDSHNDHDDERLS